MYLIKRAKDQLIKLLLGNKAVPRGLFDLGHYFSIYGPITFKEDNVSGKIIAMSTNFKYGSIVTSGKDKTELDKNIKDAILTSFEVPSSYAKEARLRKVAGEQMEYALA
ncbi:MAG: hypothetical protein WCW02_04130 [Candidatus Buchananbacteria bacterium]